MKEQLTWQELLGQKAGYILDEEALNEIDRDALTNEYIDEKE